MTQTWIEDNKKSIVANNIMAIRKSKGYSQKVLAKLAGVSVVTICNYENGVNYQKCKTVEKIASALEIDIKDLYKEVI